MNIYTVKLKSMTPLIQNVPDSPDSIERAHWSEDGRAFIPQAAIKFALVDAAKMTTRRGQGMSTTPSAVRITTSIHVLAPIILHHTRQTVRMLEFIMTSTPKSGVVRCGKRRLPCFDEWQGSVDIAVTDGTITRGIIHGLFTVAGLMVGIGAGRPKYGNIFGKFTIKDIVPVPDRKVVHGM